MSFAAALPLLAEGAAGEGAAGGGAGLFSRTANFFTGAKGLSPEGLPIPHPRPAPIGDSATLAKNTVNPGAVVA